MGCASAKLPDFSEFPVYKFPANKSIMICDILKQMMMMMIIIIIIIIIIIMKFKYFPPIVRFSSLFLLILMKITRTYFRCDYTIPQLPHDP